MTSKVILGIHSHVDPSTQGSFNQFVDGHAWISVTRDGQTQYYGLWPDQHPRVEDNGPATDIREGMESRSRASASRYYALTPEQVKRLDQALSENVTWSYTNTCASWATATTSSVTGHTLDAGELMLTDTPRELIESIRKAERVDPTSPLHPQTPMEPANQPSSGSSLSETSRSLHQQAINGVHALDASMNRRPDESSDRMAASLALLARSHGLDRIDHVVLGNPVGPAPGVRNVFVVEGDLSNPAHRRAQMDVHAAVHATVEESIGKLQQVEARIAASRELSQPDQTLDEIQQRPRV